MAPHSDVRRCVYFKYNFQFGAMEQYKSHVLLVVPCLQYARMGSWQIEFVCNVYIYATQ